LDIPQELPAPSCCILDLPLARQSNGAEDRRRRARGQSFVEESCLSADFADTDALEEKPGRRDRTVGTSHSARPELGGSGVRKAAGLRVS